MPIAIANLHIVLLAVFTLEHIQFGYVQKNALAVSSRDPPLASLSFLQHGAHGEDGRRE